MIKKEELAQCLRGVEMMKVTLLGYDIENDISNSCQYEGPELDRVGYAKELVKKHSFAFDCLWVIDSERGLIGDYRIEPDWALEHLFS